jgi:putative Holliday junction resolvase
VLASPLTIINRTDEQADIEAVVDIIQQHQVSRIIVGLPLSMNGSLSRQAGKIKAFVVELCRYTEVPLEFRDERLSTVSAKRLVQETRKTNRSTRYDAAAAALILQSYLDEVLEMRD